VLNDGDYERYSAPLGNIHVHPQYVVISCAFLLELFYVVVKILVSAYFVNSLKRLDI
jgi:hypothetical protein